MKGAGLWPSFATYHLTKKHIEAERKINNFEDLLNSKNSPQNSLVDKIEKLRQIGIVNPNPHDDYINYLIKDWDDFTEPVIRFIIENDKHSIYFKNKEMSMNFVNNILKIICSYIQKGVIDKSFFWRIFNDCRKENFYFLLSKIDKFLYLIDAHKITLIVAENFLINVSINFRKRKKGIINFLSFEACSDEEAKLFFEEIVPKFLEFVYKKIVTLEEIEKELLFIEKNYIDRLNDVNKIIENNSYRIKTKEDLLLIRIGLELEQKSK
jgi:hypothetical protein